MDFIFGLLIILLVSYYKLNIIYKFRKYILLVLRFDELNTPK